MPATFNWFDITDEEEKKQTKPNPNDWRYYAWAGPQETTAKRLGLMQEPVYAEPEIQTRRARDVKQSSYEQDPNARRLGGGEDLTPGEKFAQSVGSVASLLLDRPIERQYGQMLAAQGGYNNYVPDWVGDFSRAALTGLPQTVADVGGSIADWVTGNTGKNQNYTIAANAPSQYKNYGGMAQTIGSFVPDIAMAIGTFGATAPAAAAASASKIPGLARLARLAIGAEEAAPTAIKFMGRAISPAATRIQRVAATAAGMVPTAANVLPEVTAGRMSPVEGIASTAFGGLGGTLAAGQWGGSAIRNVLSDMGVNVATQAGAEAVTMLPGGAEFDAAQAWKNMLYGAGLGAAFGVMNAAPMRGPGERVTLGSRPAAEAPQPTAEGAARFTGGVATPVDIARGAERVLFGEAAFPETAQPQEVGAYMQQMRQRPAAEMVTLQPDETGAIRSVSDAYLTGRGQEAFPGTPESALAEAADVERKAYANSLAAEFAQTPEVLAKVLDLEVKPGEITPENAQTVLASKIENEWLVQAANGKGVAAVENVLTQAGLRGASQTPAPEAPGQPAPPAAPVPAQLPPAVAPELPAGARSMNITPENMPPVIAGELPQAQAPEYPAGTRPMAVTPENMPPVIAGELTAGTPEAVAAKVEAQVEQLKMDLGPDVVEAANSARMVADLTDQPIESIVPADSPVLQAAKSLENIENAAREELGQTAQAPEVVAPEAAEPVAREKRKRIARQIAKTEAEAPMVESIAETIPERTIVSETAVASVDPRDAAANRAGQKIAEWAETVRMAPGEELRGQRRTAKAGMDMVAEMIKPEGSVVELHPNRKGGKVSAREEFLATVSDMTVPEFRASVAAGQTDFAGGALRIEPMVPAQVSQAAGVDIPQGKSIAFSKGVERIAQIANEYKKAYGIQYRDHPPVSKLETATSKAIADAYEKMPHAPNDPKVKEAYEAMIQETKQQYQAIVDNGYKVVRHGRKGEPYSSSAAMLADLRDNKRLRFLPNDEAFGAEGAADVFSDNIGLQKSGFKLADGYELTNSEMFRVVHDFYGHGILGNEFGAIGEENATLQHLALFSDKAAPAVIAQTRGQNSWVNFSGVNAEPLEMYKQARAAERAGDTKKAKQLRKQANQIFRFAEPKIGILPDIFNFRRYATATEIPNRLQEGSNAGGQILGNVISPASSWLDSPSTRAGYLKRIDKAAVRTIGRDNVAVAAIYTPKPEVADQIRKVLPGATVDDEILEITGSPEIFHKLISAAKFENPLGAAVYVYPASTVPGGEVGYSDMRLFVTPDGKAGVALKPDGDLVSGFSAPVKGKKNRIMNLLMVGIKEGATKADCFATVLPDYYALAGFKAVGRVAFDPEMAPQAYTDQYGFKQRAWSEGDFKVFNNGKPDVVMLVYDGGDRATIQDRIGQFEPYNGYVKEQIPITSYDEALTVQQKTLETKPTAAGTPSYRVTFPEKNIVGVIWDSFNAARNVAPPEIKAEAAARRTAKSKADRIYGTSEEIQAVFEDATDIHSIYPDLPDIAVEPTAAIGRDIEADAMDVPQHVDDSEQVGVRKDIFRAGLKNKIDRANQYFYDFLEKSGAIKELGISRLDTKRMLMSKMLPGDFTKVGQAYVDRTMKPEVASRLETELNTLLRQDERIKAAAKPGSRMMTPLDEMMEVGSDIPDSYFEKAYDRLVPSFVEAQEHAATIASKAGIADPTDVWRYFMWQQEGPRPKGRRKMQEEWGSDFNDAKATEIGQAIDKVVNTDGDVYYGVDQLRSYLSGAKGAEAFQGILDANLLGNPKNPMMGLRNLPVIRNSAIFPALYGLDQYVDKIEDDETYFGIPGKTIKTFLGNGETTAYAMAGMFGVAVKGTNKAGQRTGYRARIGDNVRRTIDANLRFMGDYRSFAGMTPEQRIIAADNFMAENYPTIKPGTPEYNKIRAQKINNESYAAIAGAKISDVFNKIRSNSTKGTVGIIAQYFSDINNLGARSPFVKDYIVTPYNQLQSKTRQLMQSVEDPLNRILPDMIKRHGDNADFWDAFWATDYRMSNIDVAESGLTSEATRVAREEVMSNIKKEYFNDAATEVDARRWDDFNQLQKSIDSLRKEHFRALVAKSLGINSWDIETHYGELKIRKDATTEAYGASVQAKATIEEQLKAYTEQYNSILKSQGKEAADQAMPGFKSQRAEMLRDVSNAKANIRQMGAELDRIGKRMTKIEDIDVLVQKSIESRYLFRTRDGKAPFVLRLAFDESTGLPSVRREYNSRAEAELGRAEYLREAVAKKIETIPGYLEYSKKRSELQTELENLTNSTDFSEATDSRIQAINQELDKLDGFKPLSDMTDAEVFRFAQTYDMLGSQKTIRDMRSWISARRGSNTANIIMDQIMASTGPVKGKILSGTIDPEAITPNYIKGKGNSSLAEQMNGEVMMFEGSDAPTVGDLVDAVAKRVDEPIDRRQLEDLIEQRYTYRESSVGANNKPIETIWIDMAALRQTVDAYLDPAVPNLSRRHNWIGYYDPDGKWDAKKKTSYTVESLETMIAQIKNYNQHTALRNTVSDAMDWLNKWDINNGLREYVAGMTMYNEPVFNNEVVKTLSEYESGFSRYISMGTLFANVGSALGNRLQGATMTFANGMQNAVTKYGVRKTNADGTEGAIQWFPSEMAASAFVAKKQLDGESSWRTVEGMKWQGLFNPKSYGYGVAAMVAPGTTLKYLAHLDGYEKVPRSQQGYWALVYDASRRANLTQGGVVGSYAIREGVKTNTAGQKLSETMGWLTQKVETVNNYGSILAAAANAEGKFGLTATDWRTLNQGQRNSVIDDALFEHRQTKAASNEARALLESQIADLRTQMETQTGKQRDQTQRLIDQKLSRVEKTQSESDMLIDQLTDYLVFNRGYEQGNWDAISKAKFERMILSLPGGRLSMTMTAPILRSMNAWQGMWRRAGATQGGTPAKLGRAAAPFMGAAILTVLLGGAANTVGIPGGVFLADIGNIAEYLYYLMNNEENEKLDKAAPRQMWEKLAADLGPKYGIPSKEASNFVRAAWSEGLIRTSALDININAGSGIYDLTVGGTPAQTVLSYGKGVATAVEDIIKVIGGSGSTYDFMWNVTSAMPTSAKRLSQTVLNLTGGQGAIKLDRDGNPIIDPFTGKPQYLSGVDIVRQTFIGKPWSETRSVLTAREGGTPLYTPADRVAWSNALVKQVPYVKFGDEVKSAALFERDAEELQRAITLKTRTYKSAVEEGKNFINSMYNNNDSLQMPDGTTKTFREILSETAMAGVIPSTELKGKGAESVRNKLLQLADQWGRSRAAAEAVNEYYGGNLAIEITDKQLGQDAAYKFALKKLGQMYSQAWEQGRLRRRTRELLTP